MKIYIASKVKHAEHWRRWRDQGHNIISTWIDEAEPGQTKSKSELAVRCIEEVKQSDVVVLYCEPGEILKGALLEVGAALAAGKEVRCVGMCESISGVFSEHPNWYFHLSLQAAFEDKT